MKLVLCMMTEQKWKDKEEQILWWGQAEYKAPVHLLTSKSPESLSNFAEV